MPRRLSAVPDTSKRAVLYVRVSALMGRGGDAFHSPSMQVDAMTKLVTPRGMKVVEVVEDIDRSGRTFAREGLQRIMQLARAGEIDAVALYDLSRLGRNTAESLRHVAELRDLGVSVLSSNEQFDDSPEGQFMLGQFLGMAQLYSDQIGRRWAEVNAGNARQGLLHGRAPIGYVRTAPRTVDVDPVLGPAMTEAFRRAAAGESLQQLAREISRTAGRTIWPRTVQQALRSRAYLGQVVYLDQTFPGRHDPLTDEQTWQQVQARLDAYSRIPPRTKQARYALAGLVRCAECKRALWRRPAGARNKGDALVCRSKLHDGVSTCAGVGVPPLVDVEAAVLEELRLRLVDVDDTSAAEAVRLARQERERTDLRAVRDELARTERSIGALAVKLADEILSDEAYKAAVGSLEERAAGLRDKAQTMTLAQADVLTFTEARDMAAALLELWPGMTPQAQNAALRTHVRQVELRKATRWREPVKDRINVDFHEWR